MPATTHKPQKHYDKSRRVNILLSPDVLNIYDQLSNKSQFFRIALTHAVSVMALAELAERDPRLYLDPTPLEDVIGDFNAKHPMDPGIKRKNELERIRRGDPDGDPESNPALR